MPKWFSESEKELISRRLLEQGFKQFSTYGLKKTNIEEITRAAGISKGAFYSFYESKEALFMDVIEEVEKRMRVQILAAIDLPGPSPRARLVAILKRAFAIVRELPILQFLTGSDFDLILHRIRAEKFQEHMAADMAFFEELILHCQKAGIPIRVKSDLIVQLLFPLVISILHEDAWDLKGLPGSVDMLLELIAAYCVGEVELQEVDVVRSNLMEEEGKFK